MTLKDKIGALVMARAPKPLCDACMADYLSVRARQASAAGRAAHAAGLRRFDGQCSGCCTRRRVTAWGSDGDGQVKLPA